MCEKFKLDALKLDGESKLNELTIISVPKVKACDCRSQLFNVAISDLSFLQLITPIFLLVDGNLQMTI